jgi:methionyl-tRNA synthetase
MDAVAARYESELANDYGNLVSRTLAMIARYRHGLLPDAGPEAQLEPGFAGLADEVASAFDAVDLTGALELIWQRVRRLNRYVEESRPWELARDAERGAALDTALVTLHRGLSAVTVELAPYMPVTCALVSAALQARPIEPIPPLFPKRDR